MAVTVAAGRPVGGAANGAMQAPATPVLPARRARTAVSFRLAEPPIAGGAGTAIDAAPDEVVAGAGTTEVEVIDVAGITFAPRAAVPARAQVRRAGQLGFG